MFNSNVSVKIALNKFFLDSYPLVLVLICYKANTDYMPSRNVIEKHTERGHGKLWKIIWNVLHEPWRN